MLTETEKRFCSQSKKKRGLYISTLEQTEIHTAHVHTSHRNAKQQPEGNNVRSAIPGFGANREKETQNIVSALAWPHE